MPRVMSSDLLAAFQSNQLLPVCFVQMQFRSEFIYIWTGYGSVTWNAITWQGLGDLLKIDVIEEGATVSARGIAITLSGIRSADLSEFLADFAIGGAVTIYLGAYYPNAPTTIIPDPVAAWSGLMDSPTVEVDGFTATIVLACENALVEMNVSVERRYTNEDQQIDHPGDIGFQFVNALQEQNIYWGTAPTTGNNI